MVHEMVHKLFLFYLTLVLIIFCSEIESRRLQVSTSHDEKISLVESVIHCGFEGPKKKLNLMRKLVDVHADYIYTQDIKDP
ncbi:hypothetical protein DsansV1_C27g0203881 [Dioscorea sansibarensis]